VLAVSYGGTLRMFGKKGALAGRATTTRRIRAEPAQARRVIEATNDTSWWMGSSTGKRATTSSSPPGLHAEPFRS
jgi:hypothetical protein